MKNIDIIRGYRTFGHEDLYPSNPLVSVDTGDVIGLDGNLVTLEHDHKECGVVVEKNKFNSNEKLTGKIPVYVSNFVIRYHNPVPGDLVVGDPVTIIDGKVSKLDDDHTVVWGYITQITDTSFDVRVNY